jgi:hypothetical protein
MGPAVGPEVNDTAVVRSYSHNRHRCGARRFRVIRARNESVATEPAAGSAASSVSSQ